MRSRKNLLLLASAVGLGLLALAGCRDVSEERHAKVDGPPESDELQRPRTLLPEVEPLPPSGNLAPPKIDLPEAPPDAGSPVAGAPVAGGPPMGVIQPPKVTIEDLPDDVQAALKDLAAKAPAFNAIAFDISVKLPPASDEAGGPPGGPTSGRCEMMPPGRLRVEGEGEAEGRTVPMLLVVNGTQTWIEVRDPDSGQAAQVIKIDLSAMPGASADATPIPDAGPKADAVVLNYADEFAFDSVRDDTLDGQAVKVFEGPARMPGDVAKIAAAFAADTGLLARVQHLGPDDAVIEETALTNYDLQPQIDASRFDYTPPDGVPVMDMGEMMKMMMEGLGEAMKGAMEGMGEAMEEGLEDAGDEGAEDNAEPSPDEE